MTKNNNAFLNSLNNVAAENSVAFTENGAVAYSRTKHALTDFFYKVGSMRSWTDDKIINAFIPVYAEDKYRAMELLFFIRDCRGGQGEKRVFNVIFGWVAKTNPDFACALLKLVPEYGSWKSFFDLMNFFLSTSDVDKKVVEAAQCIFTQQWDADIDAMQEDKPISLMGKWTPSINTSSKETRKLAFKLKNLLGLSDKDYRKTLSSLRAYSKVIEVKMSAKKWNEIDYNAVPSRAGVIYRNCFLKNDEARRREWLAALKNGDKTVKINVDTLDTTTIISKYVNGFGTVYSLDSTLEAAWKALVEKGLMNEDAPNYIPVIDGSGSMYWQQAGTNIKPAYVAIGLGLYFANINKEPWRGNIISFGSHPEFYKVATDASLKDQVNVVTRYNDCGSTNIEAVFDLVLKAAVKDHLKQEDIPNIIIFSDGEFNTMMNGGDVDDEHLFSGIAKKWAKYGYTLPKLFFWNISNRSGTIPMVENPNGLGLISGYSQQIKDMLVSGKTDPYEIIIEQLDKQRYDNVRNALKTC